MVRFHVLKIGVGIFNSHAALHIDRASAGKPVATQRSSKFYFDDTPLVIQVEDTLFKVHKYQLLKSETFSDMFKTPKETNGESEEGTSPEHPIILEGVAATDFEALMTVLYASHFSSQQPASKASLIVPAFRLANMWNFSDLQNYLLPLAETVLDDVGKIVFAREFGLQTWLAPAHKNLCERSEPITTEEARKLGIDSLLLISRLREQFRPPRSAGEPRAGYCGSCAGVQLSARVITCASCNERTNHGYYHNTSPHSASTSTTITKRINQWVVDGCILKEQSPAEPVIDLIESFAEPVKAAEMIEDYPHLI